MPTRAQACAWIAGFGLVVPSLALGQDRSGRDIVDVIVREGPQAVAIRAETEVTRSGQFARLAYPNPSVQYSREGAGFTEFLQFEQPLAPFGQRGLLARAGVEATAVAEAERDARLWTLRSTAATAVARLLAEQERLTAVDAHVREVERLIEILRVREREGEGSRFDRLRAEQELRDARQAATATAIAVSDARASVSALLPAGVELGRVLPSAASTTSPLDLDTLVRRARDHRAELRALTRAQRQTQLEARAASGARLIVPTVFGGMKRADNNFSRERGGVFGLNVTIPLFDTGARQSARWGAEESRLAADTLALDAQIRVEVARSLAALTLRRAAREEDRATTAGELSQIAEVAYREGEIGILELLDAVRITSRAQTRTIDIQLEARLAELAVERAVGDVLWP